MQIFFYISKSLIKKRAYICLNPRTALVLEEGSVVEKGFLHEVTLSRTDYSFQD